VSSDTYYTILQSLLQILGAYNIERHPKKILDQVCDAIRVNHYAHNTEQVCVYWIKK
jgi:hypothetical protein